MWVGVCLLTLVILFLSLCLVQTVCQDVGGDEGDDDDQQVFKIIEQL